MARAGSRVSKKLPTKKQPLRKPADKLRSPAHNIDSLKNNLTHAIRHIDAGGDVGNRQHAKHHAKEALHDAKGLEKSSKKVPGVAREFRKLDEVRKGSVRKTTVRRSR